MVYGAARSCGLGHGGSSTATHHRERAARRGAGGREGSAPGPTSSEPASARTHSESHSVRVGPWQARSQHEGLRRLRQALPDLSLFGSSAHAYQLRPPIAEDELTSFEAAHGVRSPGGRSSDEGIGPESDASGLGPTFEEWYLGWLEEALEKVGTR